MKKIIFLSILFSLFSIGYAQDIKVDSLTGIITGKLPFDREFFLPIKHEKYLKVRSLKITGYRNGLEKSFSKRDEKRAKEFYGKKRAVRYEDKKHTILINLSDENVFKSKNGTLIQVFPLAPSTGFRFSVGFSDFSYSLKRREVIEKTFEELSNSNYTISDTASLSLKISKASNENRYKTVIALAIHRNDLENKKSFKSEFQVKVQKILDLEKEELDVSFNLDEFSTCYSKIFKFLSDCDSCSVYNRLIKKELGENNPLLVFDDELIEQIENGNLKINDSKLSKPVKEFDYTNRIKNLKFTYKIIERYLSLQMYSSDINCFENNLLTEIKAKIDHLTTIKSAWTAVIQTCTQIEIVSELDLFSLTSYYGFSEGSTTLESKGKFVVRPNLGISLATDGEFARVMPSLGVRFNLRPLDPNLPYRHILKKGLAHRSSLGITFSRTSISDGITRFDLIGKSNLLLDYGFRLNNALSLNIGTLIFLREDPRPLITGQKLAALPSLGVSIDFQILEAINDVKKVLTGK